MPRMKNAKFNKQVNAVKDKILNNKDATVITIGNFKGGVGKTTNSCLIGYALAKMGFRTLIADLDPQSNATKILSITHDNLNEDSMVINKTIFGGIKSKSFKGLAINIMDNLDLLPSHIDFWNFPDEAVKMTTNEYDADHIIDNLLKPIKPDYDVIILDTPPAQKRINCNAVVAADYIIISLQTQPLSLGGANDFIDYNLQPMVDKYDLNLEVLGIIEILTDKRNAVDKKIINDTLEEFGEQNIFKNVIEAHSRIKRFPLNGIQGKDLRETRVIYQYKKLVDEMFYRIGYFALGGDLDE